MNDTSGGMHRFLVWAAIATLVIVLGTVFYEFLAESPEKGNLEYRLGNMRLEDHLFQEALAEFDAGLKANPDHAPSHLGRALALMAMSQDNEALAAFNEALLLKPEFAAVYANRGILKDRIGKHSEALADYEKALEVDPTLEEGPGWITRFFRVQPEKPPTIADRARYLKEELAKPAAERKLTNQEMDSQQLPYKVEGAIEDLK